METRGLGERLAEGENHHLCHPMKPFGAELRLARAGQTRIRNLPRGLATAMLYREAGDWRNAIPAFAQSGKCLVQSEAKGAHHAGRDNGHASCVRLIGFLGEFQAFSGYAGGLDSICFHGQKPLLITPKRKRKLGALVDCQLSFSVAI